MSRVAREVGTERRWAARRRWAAGWRGRGRTDGQRELDGLQPDRAGAQHRRCRLAVANGDLSKKITVDVKGEILELKNTINTMVDQLNGFASK